MVTADPTRRYLITDVDVDVHDREFVRSLTDDQFADLLGQAQRADDVPADLSGKPSTMRAGDAVVFFGPPRRPSTDS